MVSFVCGRCSEVLKKVQVARHLYKCSSNVFACLDCNVDFTKTNYVGHIKCITEAQKYHGATYQPKINKGEVKQALWNQLLKEAILFTKEVNVHHLLKDISKFDNVPRKKDKFINFCLQSMHCRNKPLMEAAFDAIKVAEEHLKAQQTVVEESIKEEKNKGAQKNNADFKNTSVQNGDVALTPNGVKNSITTNKTLKKTAAKDNRNGFNLDTILHNDNDRSDKPNPSAVFKFAEHIQKVLSRKTQPTNYYELCEDLVKLYRNATGDFKTDDVTLVYNIVDTLEDTRCITFVGKTDLVFYKNGRNK